MRRLGATTFPGSLPEGGPSLTHPHGILLQAKLSTAMSLCLAGIRNKVGESPEQIACSEFTRTI